ncbi:MAG: GlsB/YeaQ/YmgE family stress response membrane protein [Solirubrobacteraceae bacterium]
MSLILFIILLAIFGLIVGALARLLLPGRDPMSISETILLGVAGTFIGGLFSWYVLHGRGSGLLISIAVAMVLLALRRMSLRRRNR